jgi:hypothetical protein
MLTAVIEFNAARTTLMTISHQTRDARQLAAHLEALDPNALEEIHGGQEGEAKGGDESTINWPVWGGVVAGLFAFRMLRRAGKLPLHQPPTP